MEKCAEAAALRRAFPEEIGSEYAAEEMEGQTYGAQTVSIVEPQTRRLHAGFEADALPAPEDPDFEAETSDSASEQPASETPTLRSDAGDAFPGDAPTTSREDETAGPAEPNGDEGTGSAVDVIAWAEKLIDDLPFMRPEQIAHLERDRKELAKFAILKATDLSKAKALEAAIIAAKEG